MTDSQRHCWLASRLSWLQEFMYDDSTSIEWWNAWGRESNTSICFRMYWISTPSALIDRGLRRYNIQYGD
jgi:hypothetical protein